MHKNNLYSSINAIFVKNPSLLPPLHAKTYEDTKKKYVLFDLPLSETLILISDYTLCNHHLSVHAEPVGALDLKSQYHYTAIFVDKERREYRLHIYFNSKDNYVGEPQLSLVKPGGVFEYVDCQEYSQAFRWLAQSACKNTVEQIRKRQTQFELFAFQRNWLKR